MTDKRILKTKQALKSTLIEMMKSQSFQKIKVKELCELANTSKLTFYTHYDDKYALLQDVAADMEQEVMNKYLELKASNQPESDLVRHNHNLLKAIFYVSTKYREVFENASKDQNYHLIMTFCEILIDAFSDEDRFLMEPVKTNYPIRSFSAFLIAGMLTYSYSGRKAGIPESQLRQQMLDLVTDLSKSNLYTD